MSSHTVGNTTAPSYGGNDTTYTEVATNNPTGMPANGYVTQIWGYFGSFTGGAMSANLLLFDGGKNLLVTANAQTVYGAAWQGANISPYYVGGGTNLGIGWFVTAEQHFGVYNGGSWCAGNPGSPSSAGSFGTPGNPYFQGGIGYYYIYIDPLSVSGVSPSLATVGQTVTISGAGFQGGSITSITFNGVAASGWTINSDSSITVTVPAGASSGTLQVNSDHGNGSTSITISGVYVFDGSAWQPAQRYVFDGSAWQQVTVEAFDGSTWRICS